MGGAQFAWQRNVNSAADSNSPDNLQGQQQLLFLLRLQRLITLRRKSADQLDEAALKGLNRCIYSTYCDCLEAGVGEEARQLLK
jgi:hypothetical protein